VNTNLLGMSLVRDLTGCRRVLQKQRARQDIRSTKEKTSGIQQCVFLLSGREACDQWSVIHPSPPLMRAGRNEEVATLADADMGRPFCGMPESDRRSMTVSCELWINSVRLEVE